MTTIRDLEGRVVPLRLRFDGPLMKERKAKARECIRIGLSLTNPDFALRTSLNIGARDVHLNDGGHLTIPAHGSGARPGEPRRLFEKVGERPSRRTLGRLGMKTRRRIGPRSTECVVFPGHGSTGWRIAQFVQKTGKIDVR